MFSVCAYLTVHVLLVPLQALDDAGVRLQTALPQLIQVVHHVVVRLHTHTDRFPLNWSTILLKNILFSKLKTTFKNKQN